MADRSGIEWTEATWNPTTGCDRISPGCDNCYALTLAKRLKAMGNPKYQRDGDPRTSGPGFAITQHPSALDVPRQWLAPRVIFVNSMSDLFHARVSTSFIRDVFRVMEDTPRHTYQVLTKRPRRAARMARNFRGRETSGSASASRRPTSYGGWTSCAMSRPRPASCQLSPARLAGRARPRRMYWLIAGGESGPNHRPLDPAWVRELRDACRDQGIAFFFKQWGGRTPKSNGRELDGRLWEEKPVLIAARD